MCFALSFLQKKLPFHILNDFPYPLVYCSLKKAPLSGGASLCSPRQGVPPIVICLYAFSRAQYCLREYDSNLIASLCCFGYPVLVLVLSPATENYSNGDWLIK